MPKNAGRGNIVSNDERKSKITKICKIAKNKYLWENT